METVGLEARFIEDHKAARERIGGLGRELLRYGLPSHTNSVGEQERMGRSSIRGVHTREDSGKSGEGRHVERSEERGGVTGRSKGGGGVPGTRRLPLKSWCGVGAITFGSIGPIPVEIREWHTGVVKMDLM